MVDSNSDTENRDMNDHSRVLFTTSLYHALNDGSVAIIPLLFPILRDLFHLSYTQVGVITGGGFLLTLIAQLIIGRKADGMNFRTLLAIGVLLISASHLLLTQSFDFFSLLLLILFIRFASSFFHPIGVGWISRTFKRARLDWAMGVQSGSAAIGAFVAIATTLAIAEYTSWQIPLYLWAILCVLGLIIGMLLTASLPDTITIHDNQRTKQTIKEAMQEGIYFLKNIRLLSIALMLSGAAWGVTLTYLPLLFQEKTPLSLTAIGLLVAVWIGIGSIASFYYGFLAKRVNRKLIVIFSYSMIGLMGVILTTVTAVSLLILIMVLLGIAVFLSYPALFSFISEVTHETRESRAFGLTFTLQLGGGTLLLMLGGWLADLFGIEMPFYLLGIPSLFLAVLLIIFYKKPYATEVF